MIVRQASTVADLWMSKTKSGFLIRFTQKRSGRLGVDMGMRGKGGGVGGGGRGGEGSVCACVCVCVQGRGKGRVT